MEMLPVAYAMVFTHRGIAEHAAGLLAFGYNRLAGMVSASLRLISIGQQQGQRLFRETHRLLFPPRSIGFMEMLDRTIAIFQSHDWISSR